MKNKIELKTSGWIFRKESAWWGLHYSKHNKRYCLNLLPCCTYWWITEGGKVPASVL